MEPAANAIPTTLLQRTPARMTADYSSDVCRWTPAAAKFIYPPAFALLYLYVPGG